jgi:hypothetical protein
MSAAIFPVMSALLTIADPMPRGMLLPEEFENTFRPCDSKVATVNDVVVDFPFEPETSTTPNGKL